MTKRKRKKNIYDSLRSFEGEVIVEEKAKDKCLKVTNDPLSLAAGKLG